MFWISKNKATFRDAWRDGFVDIHNHLLPGIDDGAKSLANTTSMIQGMQELGITEAIATPHTYPGLWNNTKEKILNAYENVNHSFLSGASSEYFVDDSLNHLNDTQGFLPLKDNYLLIEFSMMNAPMDRLLDVLFSLKVSGYRLILAHPERYLYWEKNLNQFEALKSFDLDFQLNSLSILGHYGESCKKIANYLLVNDFYDFLGTDFHHEHHIEATKRGTFPEKQMNKIMTLVQANQQFGTH